MIIGIMGFAHTGKNKVAEILQLRGLERGEPFIDMAFADELKRVVMHLFDFTEEQCWGILKEIPDHRYLREHSSKGVLECDRNEDGVALCDCCRTPKNRWMDVSCYLTPRYAQQIMGTEGARICYKDIWVKISLNTATLISGGGGYYYHRTVGARRNTNAPLANVVFTDVRFINEYEGIKKAGGKVYRVKRKGYDKPSHNHLSETEQLQIPDDRLDGVINNDDDLDRLEREVLRVMGWSP